MINLLVPKKSWQIPAKKMVRKNHTPLLALLAFFVLIFEVALLQFGALGVNAQISPSGSPDHLDFGLVFPSERLSHFFKVFINENPTEKLEYYIVQYPKPRPAYVQQVGKSVAQQYCRAHPQDLELCYPDLCAYLTKTATDPGESDTEFAASLDPADFEDVWQVQLDVPAIEGYIAQDHAGGSVEKENEYGCDIAVIIKEGNGNGGDGGDGEGGGDGGDGEEEELVSVFHAATSPLQMVLPAKLPKVGEWSIGLTLALIGFGAIFSIWRKR